MPPRRSKTSPRLKGVPDRPGTKVARSTATLPRVIKAQIWVESAGGPALTDDGADLLDQIGVCGSLSEAARRLRFSYRRAWMLLDVMNRRWPEPLVFSETGGKRGGGAQLTDFGRHVLSTFRDLQVRLEHFVDLAGDPFVTNGG